MSEKHHLKENLRKLRLPGMLDNFELRIKQAEESQLGYLDFLSLVIQDETEQRNLNRFRKSVKDARFGSERTFEQFDFKFNDREISISHIKDLATCRFIDLKENVLLAGPPGIGKTHIAKSLGHEACRRKYSVLFSKTYSLLRDMMEENDSRRLMRKWKKYSRVDVLIFDDFGFRKMSVREAELFYELLDERIGNGVMMITSNIFLDECMENFYVRLVSKSRHASLLHQASFRFR